MEKKKDKRSTRERFVDSLSGFLQRNRVAMLSIAILALVGIASFAIYAEVSSRRAEDALVRLEAAQARVDERQGLSGEEQDALDTELLSDLADIVDSHPRTYAAQRSLFLMGIINMDREDYGQAAEAFGRLADRFTDGHLAFIARANQATAYEEQGDADSALTAYRQLLELRPSANPLRARALFSIGRLTETAVQDSDGAREYYERVVNEFPQSDWTSLARNRLLALTTVAP